MKNAKFFLAMVALAAFAIGAFAQPPDTLWTRTYGYMGTEYGYSVQQTPDGGFIMTGYSSSFGAPDFYFVKTDASGDTLWTRRHGGMAPDVAHCIDQCTDGGYIALGYTFSYGAGAMDFYLVKTNSSGDTLWTRTYGGTNVDMGRWVRQTEDGGYILTGGAASFGAGSDDFYLIKTDASGVAVWSRTYGGAGYDHAHAVEPTTDGGYIVAGYTTSFGAGNHDLYLVKTNSVGDTLWTRTYGGIWSDYAYGVQQTTDGGYIMTGATASFGTGTMDIYLLKVDSVGDTLWSRTFGGGGVNDYGECVQQTTDGGYIVAGYTDSFSGTIDVYLMRTASDGSTIWTQIYGGGGSDQAYSIQQLSDGGYIVGGQTMSFGAGNMDYYLIRLEAETITPPVSIGLMPQNPPIQIPAGGGSFNFDLAISNSSSSTYIIDAELDATLPGGSNYPILLRVALNLPAGFSIVRPGLTQFIPAGAPAGDYTYNGHVYNHATWELLAEDSFDFVKLAGVDVAAHNLGWSLFGWDEGIRGQTVLPTDFDVISTHPNPFNPATTMSFALPQACMVRLGVYDLSGCRVADLVNGWREAGAHQVVFDGSNLASGVYLAKLEAGSSAATQKLLLLK